VLKVVEKINEKTKVFQGMKVPVKIVVDVDTKNFEITVGTPPVSALIKKELNIEKGSKTPKTASVGNLTMKQVLKIAEMKSDSLFSRDMKRSVRQIVGSCVSMGVTIEDKDPRIIQKEIEEGKWDKILK
jgi:large subunit ribosomal protein L11